MEHNAVIPFGKYKGQPLELLAEDKEYCTWLMAQGWFVERYPKVHTLIVNNFGEPTETPEHNRLQLRFLEDELRQKMMHLLMPEVFFGVMGRVQFEVKGADVFWACREWTPIHRCDYHGSGTYFYSEGEGKYEWCNVDSVSLGIECKPSLGDDYPAVLRYIKGLSVQINAVVIERWTARGASFEQAQLFFATAGVALHFLATIEATTPATLWDAATLPAAQSVYECRHSLPVSNPEKLWNMLQRMQCTYTFDIARCYLSLSSPHALDNSLINAILRYKTALIELLQHHEMEKAFPLYGPETLLEYLQSLGLQFRVDEDGTTLQISPPRLITRELAALIRANKSSLIAMLTEKSESQ